MEKWGISFYHAAVNGVMFPTSMQRFLVPIITSGAVACVGLVLAAYWLDGAFVNDGNKPITLSGNSSVHIPHPNLASSRSPTNTPPARLKTPPARQKEIRPTFDIALIEPSGEAVIAGRAAPGSTVELLGDGKVQGRAMAGKSGEFVIVRSRLLPGMYKLSLRSTDAEGKEALSTQTVSVSLDQVAGGAPKPTPTASGTPTPQQSEAAGSTDKTTLPDARTPEPALGRQHNQLPVANALLGGAGSSSAPVASKSMTTTVSRGDSLWRISRSTYGKGSRYPVIFGANRNKIRNPNLIYPGQIFVLPKK